jgi:surface carbohydrate biosynthesis protein
MSNSKKYEYDIVLFIEHVDREMEVALSLKEKLDSNHKVLIVSLIFHLHLVLLHYKIKTIVTPFVGFGLGSVSNLFFKVHNKNINFINLNFEQFLAPFNLNYKMPRTTFSKNFQIHIAWGHYFKQQLIKYGVNEKNIYITGRPYDQIIQKKAILNNKIANKKCVIFIALTDGLAFLNKRQYIEMKNLSDNPKLFEDFVKHDIETVNKIAKLINKLNLDENDVIIRPHPSVPIDVYLNLFKGYNFKDKIIITKSYDALYWLNKCDILITNYSTLIVDARRLNKKIFLFNRNKNFDFLWWQNFSNGEINENNELVELEYNKSELNIINNKLNFYISEMDAIEETSNLISKVTNSSKNYSKGDFFKKISLFFNFRFLKIILNYYFMKYFNNIFNFVPKGSIIDYFIPKMNNEKN